MLGLRQFLQFTILLTAFAACEKAPEPAPLQRLLGAEQISVSYLK